MSIISVIGMISDCIAPKSNDRWSSNAACYAIAKGLLLALALLLGNCGGQSRTVVEIVTREGATFIVVEAEANYERVCTDGQYSSSGDPDKLGLRAVLVNKEGSSYNEIPWATINSISFAEPKP